VFFSVVVGAVSSRSSWELLNRTSLHPLYTARLIRAYLGASNKSRYGSTAPGLSDPVDGDDLPQEEYWRPDDSFWSKGAPLHLVNVTINETLDGRTQTEQRDRKGVGMAVGPAGFSVGVQHHVVFKEQTPVDRANKFAPVKIFPGPAEFAVFGYKEQRDRFYGRPLSLGNWVGISGAAVSTGLGNLGSLGTSLLTGFFNLRLGYWWDSGTKSITPGDKKLGGGARFSSLLGKWMAWLMPVQSSLLDEFLGRFHGTVRRYWYLTDGGHFENLAGYELIRRRLPVMIIVDAAGDPEYSFADLANLIRKARLDFNADITFMDPSSTDRFKQKEFEVASKRIEECFASVTGEVLGTIDQLRRGTWASEPTPKRRAFFRSVDESRLSLRHAAVAKVTYLDDRNRISYLLLIKPTLTGEEPQDLLNYHSSHPAFPHESTAEQFFNEAQWESYRRLGQHIGERLFS
jgi:hypothetical protein